MAGKEIDPEDLPFEVPKFDEDEFVRKELISFRTTVILFVYTLLVAVGTFFLWETTGIRFSIIFLIAMAMGGALPFIYKMFRVDIAHWKRREWIGTAALHFFFWLGFTLLLTNPPLSDSAAPVIEGYATPAVQGVGELVNFAAYVGDNKGIAEESLLFCLTKSGSDACLSMEWTHVAGLPIWTAQWRPDAAGNYSYAIEVTDKSGRETKFRANLTIGNPFPVIDPKNGETLSSLSQSVIVRPDSGFKELYSVQYVIENVTYNMSKPSADRPAYWTTNPTFPGWKTGTNQITFIAKEQPVYLHNYKLEGGVARSSASQRTYNVDANFPDLHTANQPVPTEKKAPGQARQSPGLEAPAFLLVVGLLVLVLRTRLHERA